ncbi:MAG: hypothetical protein OHK0029_37920 [Armatimonadaceae bacterium]
MATSENARERLNRYIDDAIAIEAASITGLKEMADDTKNPGDAALFQEHLAQTEQQKMRLEEALKARGGEPSGTKQVINKLGVGASQLLHANKDEEDKATRFLIEAYTVGSMEVAMYESLIAAADLAGDTELAQLARDIQSQEDATRKKIMTRIAPVAQEAMGEARPTVTA